MKNLLYIHTHDSGRYFSPYGYAIPTPNIQSLAEESLLFRQAYCAAPTCSPSRAALLTGTCAHTSGMLGLAHRGFSLSDYDRHLSFYLRKNGFCTALSGIQHEAAKREQLGYEKFLVRDDQPDPERADAAAAFLREYDGDRPFFLSVGLVHTHRAYPEDIGEINPDYVQPVFPLQDNAENRLDMARYMRSAQIADDCVGRVLRALKESGHEKDTVVLFTTDHGIAMPFMKCNLYDTGTGVAMMLHIPGNPHMGKVTDSLVSHLDVYPTVCDLLHVPKPEWLQGKSLLPILENPEAEIREEVFAEVTYHAAYEPMRSVRTKDYKLICFYDDHNKPVPANIDDGIPKQQLLKAGLLNRVRAREMLFDLRFDPMERENQVNNPQYGEIYRSLQKKLEDWMEETDDPLLHCRCRVKAPAGARINTRDSIQPYYEEWE